MRNRAKCKLCNSIIESFHSYDFVQCTCGEIFVDAGDGLRCGAKDWVNFLRVDDEGKETPITVKEGKDTTVVETTDKIDPLEALRQMVAIYGELPKEAQHHPVTNSDMHSILILLEHILSEKK